ncbi:hypothetical protein WAA20_15715 [Butyrivibrio fibrisolvens]|uniref:hypothetical protein n=1 Tax=Butyrivibrio fibrisolvens TaxID=831 RepID=UPI0030D54904
MYNEQIKSTKDMYQKAIPYLQKDVESGILFAIKILNGFGINDIDKDLLLSFVETKYDNNEEFVYGDRITYLIDDVIETMEYLSRQAERNQRFREEGRKYKGNWSGGGFGLKGALKGAAMAGALNLTEGFINNLVHDAATYGDDKKIKEKFNNLYNQKHRAFYNAYEEYYLTDIFSKLVMILSDKGIVKWRPYQEEENENAISALQNNPYNTLNYYRLYNELQNSDEKKKVKEIAKLFGIQYFYLQSICKSDNESIEEILKTDLPNETKLEQISKIGEYNPDSKASEYINILSKEINNAIRIEHDDLVNSIFNATDWYDIEILDRYEEKLNKLKLDIKKDKEVIKRSQICKEVISKVKSSLIDNIFLALYGTIFLDIKKKGVHLYSLGELVDINTDQSNPLINRNDYNLDGSEFPIFYLKLSSNGYIIVTTQAFYIKDHSKEDRFLINDIKDIGCSYSVFSDCTFDVRLKNNRYYFEIIDCEACLSLQDSIHELNRIINGTSTSRCSEYELLSMLSVDRIEKRRLFWYRSVR